jgi:hypothetical protein
MPTSLFPRIQDDEPVFEIDVLPQKPVDFTHASHCFTNRPKVVLGVRVSNGDYLVDFLTARNILDLLFDREKAEPSICLRVRLSF